jgi:hypothetical protein
LGYICGKGVKTEKIKEKSKKKMALGIAVLLLIRRKQFPCSVESCGALIFWPLRSLVRRAGAMILPVRLCAVKVGGTCAGFFVVSGLGGTVAVTPVAVEVQMSSW